MTFGHIINLHIATALCFILAACQDERNTAVGIIPDDQTCRANEFTQLIGQDKDVLKTLTLPKRSRVIGVRTAVTTDYIKTRVNFVHDSTGKIKAVGCY